MTRVAEIIRLADYYDSPYVSRNVERYLISKDLCTVPKLILANNNNLPALRVCFFFHRAWLLNSFVLQKHCLAKIENSNTFMLQNILNHSCFQDLPDADKVMVYRKYTDVLSTKGQFWFFFMLSMNFFFFSDPHIKLWAGAWCIWITINTRSGAEGGTGRIRMVDMVLFLLNKQISFFVFLYQVSFEDLMVSFSCLRTNT